MKIKYQNTFVAPALVALFTLNLPLPSACAQSGTAFTYQGRLATASGAGADGTYDLTFTLFGPNIGGVAIAGPITNSPVAVTNWGFFTTTVDFGNAFDGSPRWLEIGVRTNGGGAFTILSPRQQVTPTPYALNATMLANGVALGSGGGNSVSPIISPDSFIGGGSNNVIYSPFSVIGGGNGNMVGREWTGGVIGGGSLNVINANYGAVAGGYLNQGAGQFSTVGGGSNNVASGQYSTVGGGEQNQASGIEATVGGGTDNMASGQDATVSGGYENTASGLYATVSGGNNNTASGYAGFAAGYGANASYDHCFVWSDGDPFFGGIFGLGFGADHANQFKIAASGGVEMDVSGSSGVNPAALFINSPSANGVGLYVLQTNSTDAAIVVNSFAGRSSSSGGGDIFKGFGWTPGGFGSPNQVVFEVTVLGDVTCHSLTQTSDRNAKENLKAISPADVLQKVVSMPITEWNFKGDMDKEHIGPMAQDFHAAFELNGSNDKGICVTDEGGVALAAIQGLNQKLNDKDTELQNLKRQNEALEKRLDDLAQTLKSLAETK